MLLAGARPAQSAENTPPGQTPPTASMPIVARVHWSGMKQLSGGTNAASLLTIWNLPESRRLEQQTLDKLSLAPWPLLHRNLDTNAAALLRPLLDDLVAGESYLEIRQVANQPAELALAIRLDDQRAALWQTNLAAVLESLTSLQPVPAPQGSYGWSLKKHHSPNVIELTRIGAWTIVGAAEDFNGLIAELRLRTHRALPPWNVRNPGDWLEADLDPARLAAVFSLSARTAGEVPSLAGAGEGAHRAVEGGGDENKSSGRGEVGSKDIFTLNRLHLSATGDVTNVLLNGTVDFPEPLALELKPWNIPTNLIDEHLSGFTAIRGFQPWLASSPFWTNLQIGPPPDQICFWAMPGLNMLSYFATPLPEASNTVSRLTDLVLRKQYRWFPTNGLSKFEKSAAFNGLEWKGVPYMYPFVLYTNINRQSFIFGGAFQPIPPALPLSLQSLQAVLNRTNAVYYDWEITGPRTEQWLYMGQFARLVCNKDQLPFSAPATLWLKDIAPRLGASLTVITQTGPNQLSFTRKSTIGFTGIELNLLADWLESPQFPIGLHTFLAPPPQ